MDRPMIERGDALYGWLGDLQHQIRLAREAKTPEELARVLAVMDRTVRLMQRGNDQRVAREAIT